MLLRGWRRHRLGWITAVWTGGRMGGYILRAFWAFGERHSGDSGICLTTRVSDRRLTEKVGMQRGDHKIKTVWQTRWLVAVHLDPMVRPLGDPVVTMIQEQM